jgi:hypothetical protein
MDRNQLRKSFPGTTQTRGVLMKLLLFTCLVILALGSTAFSAERIVHYEHFTAAW